MKFLIFRRADPGTETGALPDPRVMEAVGAQHEALAREGRLHAGVGLRPSAEGVRVHFAEGKPVVVDGPFAETKELVAGFSLIEADSLDAAVDWAKQWPAFDADGQLVLEIRSLGCAGGLPGFGDPANASPDGGRRFAVLLKSDRGTEDGLDPGTAIISAMAQANRRGVEGGYLLAGEGLQSSAQGKRVKFSDGKPTVIDGPFAEIKELVAGFWVLQVKTMDEVLAWVATYPFPQGKDAQVEIRPLYEAADFA
jgi:hypothetical protein